MGKLSFTIKIFIIVLLAFLFISAWSEVIIRGLIKYFDLDKEDINTWIILGILSTFVLFLVVMASNIEIHDLFGTSETVDVELTGMKERFVNGKVKHYY